MRTVAVYPGRFHVFHQGHRAVYDHLVKKFGAENVYIATSAKQNDKDSPFTLADKVAMMTKMGVPASRIIQVTNTYKKDETAKDLGLDPDADHLVYALGAKDAERFKYTPESPLQLLSQTKKMKPVGKHAYVEVVPTATFNVLGKPVQNASEIRKMYLDGNDNDRNQIIADLYGSPDPELKTMFDQRLGVNTAAPEITYGAEIIDGGDSPPVQALHERKTLLLKKITEMRKQLNKFRQIQLSENAVVDYIDEKTSSKK